jgi:hypothetical protein
MGIKDQLLNLIKAFDIEGLFCLMKKLSECYLTIDIEAVSKQNLARLDLLI